MAENKDKDYKALYFETLALLIDAKAHLEYCGYGDRWEKECSEQLRRDMNLFFARQDICDDSAQI
jgi:hypothetical protein